MINLYEYNMAAESGGELTDVLYEDRHIRVERIVSMGQTTPESFVYDQKEDELVTVIKGEAALLLTDEDRELHLYEGDSFMIYAGVKHKVIYTSSPCIWYCVFNKVTKDE